MQQACRGHTYDSEEAGFSCHQACYEMRMEIGWTGIKGSVDHKKLEFDSEDITEPLKVLEMI